MLRRFSSASFPFTRSASSSGSTSPPTSAKSAPSFSSSSLDDALSSTVIPPVPTIDRLVLASQDLISCLESLQTVHRSDYTRRLGLLVQLQQVLAEYGETRNTFRDHGGFLTAISILASLEEAAAVGGGEQVDTVDTRSLLRYELVKLVFGVLALAFQGNDLNRAHFVEIEGFGAVREAIKLSGLMRVQSAAGEEGQGDTPLPPSNGSPAERLLSILYAFLTADFASPPIYTHVRLHLVDTLASRAPLPPIPDDALPSDDAPSTGEVTPLPELPTRTAIITEFLVERLPLGEVVENSSVVPLLLELQANLDSDERELGFMVLASVQALAVSSRRSQVALNEVGVVAIVLDRLFPAKGAEAVGSQEERDVMYKLVDRLLEMGAGTKETRRMFAGVVDNWKEEGGKPAINEEMLSLILNGVRQSRYPSFLHFDLTLHGYSALSLQTLGRPFPPPTLGYTFLTWLSIEEPPSDLDERLVIFGCGDTTGKCHLELSITPDLHIALATSLGRPPVVFSTFAFELGRFYHIALVHQRPKYSSFSPVSLYIDGALIEVGKAPYPAAPPKDWEVQGWLGTPKDRVPHGRVGKGKSRLKWDLGPTWLVHADVPEEMVYVCSTLGPRYTGNFQDQLGQFQTNSTSTLLNIRLDALPRDSAKSPNKHLDSPLVHAIRDRGSAVIPESQIYFAFSARNVLVAGSTQGLSGSSLSETAQQSLILSATARGKVIVNSAILKIETALVQPHGLGRLEGDPCVANPNGLDVAIWKVGGVAMALRLVELSTTPAQLSQTVALFIELVDQSWRNSEDTERMQGYEILSLHLRSKPTLMTLETHGALLSFVGYDFEDPSKSIVSNPLAFRFLVLDFGLWSTMEQAVQWAHIDTLRTFVQSSEHREFNTRRLAKMHIVRKLLYALRVNLFDAAMVPEVVETLMLVVSSHFTTETVRHLATFLTATLCQVVDPKSTSPSSTFADPETSFILDASQVEANICRPSLRVLEALHEVLLTPERTQHLAKFAKIITTKWMILFLLDKQAHPLSAVLALRILVRILQSQGPASVTKFIHSTDGFSIMRVAIPHLWNFGQIHLAMFALLHGQDICALPLDAPFASATFASTVSEVSSVAPDVVRIVIACLGKGLKVLAALPPVEIVVVVTSGEGKVEDEASTTPSVLTFAAGFDVLLDLLSKANRYTPAEHELVTSATPLQDLAAVLRPFLRLPPSDHPASDPLPLLPILSLRTSGQIDSGFALRGHPAVNGSETNGGGETNGEATPPTTDPVDNRSPSSSGPISPAAVSLLQFFSAQISHAITTRHVPRPGTGNKDPAASPYTDPSLRILRDIFDAAATIEVSEQVIFRTLLLKDVTKRLSRASSSASVSARIASFVRLATNQAFEGWHSDLRGLLDFVLLYLEKLLDEGSLGMPVVDAGPSESLFKSLNRLILLALAQGDADAVDVLDLLARHQMSVFAPQNSDEDFFQCLMARLDMLLRIPQRDSVVDFYKLLILQRPNEIESALGQTRRHNSEASLVGKLIDADTETFCKLLAESQSAIDELQGSWSAFLEFQIAAGHDAVDSEQARLLDLARDIKSMKDLSRRKTRKHRIGIYDWSEGIHDVEATRVAHTRQDISDHAAFVATEWQEQIVSLEREGAIWGGVSASQRWQLDFTEGHCRMRKKLQADLNRVAVDPVASKHRSVLSPASRPPVVDMNGMSPIVHTSTADSVTPEEDKIWGEGGFGQPFDVVEADSQDVEEDKNRKVRRSLEPGDVILSVFNTSRIVGLDACPVLLLLAKKNIYLVDNFFQKANGDLVNAWDAPADERDQHLSTLADLAGRDTKKASIDLGTAHHSRRWAWSDLLEVYERKYLFRNVALELFFADGRSFLITFAKDQRSKAYEMIASRCPSAVALGSLNFAAASFGAKVSDAVLGQRTKLDRMTKRWERREISNFEYLMFLNASAGRTYNDLTNYPVFPWILNDYTSAELDLSDPKTFRDLTKPMGCQTEERQKEFQERYAQLVELDDGTTKPFHYGTHYSSAMIVVGYMVRLRPFTESYLDLQGGTYDHADRMFWSVARTWESCSKLSRSDVRELTPEWFYLADFLRNSNGLELGIRQETGGRIDNVELPPWAKDDPRLFIELNRQALESEYVSTHLGHWIDLIFGFHQSGEAAVDSCNVFHSLSYEGAIDLDTIEDADERKAATSTIHNFGICPRQLFTKPHSNRIAPLTAKATRPIFSPDLHLELQLPTLILSILPILSLPTPVAKIYPGSTPEKTTAVGPQRLLFGEEKDLRVEWGYADGSVRVIEKGGGKVGLFEGMQSEFVGAAHWADDKTFVLGSTDTNVSLWKFVGRSHSRPAQFNSIATLRGHSDQITCVAASKAFSVVVSGSNDKSAIIWDLNRHRFVHRLEGHESRVNLVAISDMTGDIATCSGSVLRLWTVNGVLLASVPTNQFVDPITAVAFSLSETTPVIATGHRAGKIQLWQRVSSDSPTGWSLELRHTLTTSDRLAPHPRTSSSTTSEVTSLAFTLRALYSGDASGKVWLWNPVGTEVFLPDSSGGGACMTCECKFGILEARRRCSACAGIFCSLDTTTSPEVGGRFCAPCFSTLSALAI